MNSKQPFKWKHFQGEVILLCVRWYLKFIFKDIFPTEPEKRDRGMPHSPFRYVLNTLLYVLITGCRWCDVPKGKIWASKSSATNSVRPMLKAWTNQRFVMVKALAK